MTTPPAAATSAARTAATTFSVNGEQCRLDLDTRVSLLDALRERLHLTGTKKGCNQGAG